MRRRNSRSDVIKPSPIVSNIVSPASILACEPFDESPRTLYALNRLLNLGTNESFEGRSWNCG